MKNLHEMVYEEIVRAIQTNENKKKNQIMGNLFLDARIVEKVLHKTV